MPVVQCRVDVMTVSSGIKACLGAIALALTGTLFAQESEHEPGETEHARYAISGFIGGGSTEKGPCPECGPEAPQADVGVSES